MAPNVDLVIVFRTNSYGLSKQQARDDARKAELQYSSLLHTLTEPGLRAVGRRGETQGQLLILVSCPQGLLRILAHRERHSDFVYGLPTALPTITTDNASHPLLTPADRLRLVHTYITSTTSDGGLGILPRSEEWDLVESVLGLHDHEFNEVWIRSWTTRQIASVKLEKIRDQFGDSVALYFSFLSSYTRALLFPSLLGIPFYFLKRPYSPLYTTLLLLWSITFVEWWTIRERILSVRWGTRGSAKVEKRRAGYVPGFPWWKRELRMVASVPVIAFFGVVLAGLLTAIFVFEAFVTHLYTGPGHKYISFSPTILFVALVPSLLAIYQSSARKFTQWENHAHQSTHDASLTIKTFTLSAIVAYLGLALSAFVYVPFGGEVMQWVQVEVFGKDGGGWLGGINGTWIGGRGAGMVHEKRAAQGVWLTDVSHARRKLNPSRLQDQMFAYTVTNQIINTFTEIGLPYILRFVGSFRNGKGNGGRGGAGKKKRVGFEDEVVGRQQQQQEGGGSPEKDREAEKAGADSDKAGKEDREFLERVRREVALPPYDLFGDYSEMATQFGYVVLWSTIWPLAPVMALLNNFLELRSDAFKITHHNRRPLPMRTDSIGPWLESLSFLTWLAALTNSALVYLFHGDGAVGKNGNGNGSTTLETNIQINNTHLPETTISHSTNGTKRDLLFKAALIALAASHGYIIVRGLVRHLLEKIVWSGCKEIEEAERNSREVKGRYLERVGGGIYTDVVPEKEEEEEEGKSFWVHDEGLDEIRRAVKDA